MSHWEPLWLSVDHAGVSGSWLLWMFRGTYYGKPSNALGPPHQRADIPVRSAKTRGAEPSSVSSQFSTRLIRSNVCFRPVPRGHHALSSLAVVFSFRTCC